MTTKELKEKLNLRTICAGDETREVTGGYCGDLLSWVMGRAHDGCAWVTVMSNLNVIAVATLADVACVILAEGAVLDADALERAKIENICVYATDKTSFEVCRAI